MTMHWKILQTKLLIKKGETDDNEFDRYDGILKILYKYCTVVNNNNKNC